MPATWIIRDSRGRARGLLRFTAGGFYRVSSFQRGISIGPFPNAIEAAAWCLRGDA